MEIAIIHLTDIHFTHKTELGNKIHAFCQAIIKEIRQIKRVYFVISGDIAFSGKKVEYEKAKSFISTVKQLLVGQFPDLILKYIIVPGNHDCNLDDETQLRINAIQNINYQSLGNDNSVVDLCLSVQKEFWEFYGEYNSIPADKMSFQVTDEVDGKSISFDCINTAWMSKLDEEVGGIFFPVKKYTLRSPKPADLQIGVWHHPYNWFTPNTPENNKKEFEQFTEGLAPVHLFGHEHENSFYSNTNRNSGERVNLLSGEMFNDDKKKSISGFQVLIISLNTNIGEIKKYQWNSNLYSTSEIKDIDLNRPVLRSFKMKEEFMQRLEDIRIPLVIERKTVKQSDIFVFPDLDGGNNDAGIFENYFNSERLLDSDTNHCVLDGESQIGKTTLLNMLTLKLYERTLFPVLLAGKDLRDAKGPNLLKVIKKAFKLQYDGGDDEFERFLQLDIKKKTLIIDDYQDCEFNSSATKEIFEKAITEFGKVIIMLDSASSIMPSIKSEFHDVYFYSLKPLGFKKRNELIENYHFLKANPYTIDDQIFLDKVKSSFDNVQGVLGDRLIPSYPIYILSILQAFEYKPLKQNETSFGYCYQTLIHYSLHKAGVINDDIDTYFNFLTELAYEFICRDIEYMNDSDLNGFYYNYQKKFISPSYDVLLKALKRSNIIFQSEEGIKFGYDYILYYLSAKKIADILHLPEGRAMITTFFKELHIERNANILVFITHHSKDISFIEESLLTSMTILDSVNPITLEKSDSFSKEIADFADALKNNILETNRNPKEERDKMLMAHDKKALKIEREQRNLSQSDTDEMKAIILPFHQSFRSIEIVGQIIKNRKGSLPISQLNEMIAELYITGFRTIGYMSNLLISAREDIIELINKETNNSDDKRDIERRVTTFIQMISFDACVSVFTKLTRSVGNKDLKNLYTEVARKINTPAAKIVSFSINSYYGNITPEEVRELAQDFKGNIVALRLLRGRVRQYVYNKNPDFKIKQKLASYLDMTLSPAEMSKGQAQKSKANQ